MRILVTNDDGIESTGIHVLAGALHDAGHDVVVVAPDRNWSGAGAAIGDLDTSRPLEVRRVEIPNAPSIPAWALAGPPGLTVIASRLGAFGEPADLVVSGINAGLNTGRSILHSGTVGAVLTGQNFGISGLAVSLESSDPWWWETAALLAVEVLDLVVDAPERSALNLNVPARPRAAIEGVRWARLAPFGAVRARVRSTSETSLDFVLEPTGYEPGPETDQGCVDRGFAAITTLVGVVEAWPEVLDPTSPRPDGYTPHVVPGAALHPVHTLPDATDHRLLRRPESAS